MQKELVVTSLLSHEPSPEAAEYLAVEAILDSGLDPDEYSVSFFSSHELPPENCGGLPLYEQDQLFAHKRDAGPAAVFFTVLAERL